MNSSAIIALLALSLPYGCQQQHEPCNLADSPGICAQVQKCFASGVSPITCREVEHDAIEVSKPPLQAGANGAANALRY
jgi:hypothetical protein